LIDTIRQGERGKEIDLKEYNHLVLSILINEMIKIITAKSLKFVTFSSNILDNMVS